MKDPFIPSSWHALSDARGWTNAQRRYLRWRHAKERKTKLRAGFLCLACKDGVWRWQAELFAYPVDCMAGWANTRSQAVRMARAAAFRLYSMRPLNA